MKISTLSRKATSIPLLLAAAYFLIVHWSMGLRVEHLLLCAFLLFSYFIHARSRRFVLDFLPFVFFGVLYDFLRLYPKSWAGPIHVVWPYKTEKLLFGIPYEGQRILLTEFFRTHSHAVLDLLTGFLYSLHMIIPIAFSFFVWFRHPTLSRRFNWTFFLLNFFAFITYIALPVAPPWYIELYGFQPATWSVPPSAAGLLQFDRLIGTPYFQGVYAHSAWVFGAVPSMHAGFPLLVFLFARRVLNRNFLIPLFLFLVSVWFSALYLRHHYVIDLLAGALYVCISLLIEKRVPGGKV